MPATVSAGASYDTVVDPECECGIGTAASSLSGAAASADSPQAVISVHQSQVSDGADHGSSFASVSDGAAYGTSCVPAPAVSAGATEGTGSYVPALAVFVSAQLSTRSKLLRRSHFCEQAGYKPVLQLGGPAVMCRGFALASGVYMVWRKAFRQMYFLVPGIGLDTRAYSTRKGGTFPNN